MKEELKFQPMPKERPQGDELEYRKALQEAILHVTQKVIEERKEEILERAKARIDAIRLLSR